MSFLVHQASAYSMMNSQTENKTCKVVQLLIFIWPKCKMKVLILYNSYYFVYSDNSAKKVTIYIVISINSGTLNSEYHTWCCIRLLWDIQYDISVKLRKIFNLQKWDSFTKITLHQKSHFALFCSIPKVHLNQNVVVGASGFSQTENKTCNVQLLIFNMRWNCWYYKLYYIIFFY